jgi:predicted deacetylase
MRQVILRDDDTNALTPVECLERLYRPFLDRGMPVNLATIPEVSTDARTPDGAPEEFLFWRNGATAPSLPIESNATLVNYLRQNPGYHIVQHGCHHNAKEFDALGQKEAARRAERGTKGLMQAGFPKPETFVAPHDKFSRASMEEIARRFRVISTGWFELGRVPISWWPNYAMRKLRRAPHWRHGQTVLLSHPGCILSRNRPREKIVNTIIDHLRSQPLNVLVTHWWEYYRNGQPDESFIAVLHEVADYLASQKDIKVISFGEL